MKKTATRITALLLCTMTLFSCAGGNTATTTDSQTTGSQTTAAPDIPDVPEVKGMKWSDDRIIPKFDPPEGTMDALRSSDMTFEEQIMFSTLQGIVNRSATRILLIDEGAD